MAIDMKTTMHLSDADIDEMAEDIITDISIFNSFQCVMKDYLYSYDDDSVELLTETVLAKVGKKLVERYG